MRWKAPACVGGYQLRSRDLRASHQNEARNGELVFFVRATRYAVGGKDARRDVDGSTAHALSPR